MSFTFNFWSAETGRWRASVAQSQGHLWNWLSPIVTIAKSPPDPYRPVSWPHIINRKNCLPWYSPSSALTNHLMPPFQQQFSSWGYKNWLLTQERVGSPLSLVAVLTAFGRPSLVRRSAHCACSTLIISAPCSYKVTPCWNTLCQEILFQPAQGLPQQ